MILFLSFSVSVSLLLLKLFSISFLLSHLIIPRKDVTFCKKTSLLLELCDLSLLLHVNHHIIAPCASTCIFL